MQPSSFDKTVCTRSAVQGLYRIHSTQKHQCLLTVTNAISWTCALIHLSPATPVFGSSTPCRWTQPEPLHAPL